MTRSPLNRTAISRTTGIDLKSSLSPRRTFVTRTSGASANRVEISPAPGLNHHSVQTIVTSSPNAQIRTSPVVTTTSHRTGTPIQYHSEEITIQDNVRTLEDSVQRRNLSTLLNEFNSIHRYVAGDRIDEALHAYIMNSVDSETLAKLFLRESSGVYLFGSKVVTLVLENDILYGNLFSGKLNLLVRHGSSFLPIDQFLDIHARVELEKMSRGRF